MPALQDFTNSGPFLTKHVIFSHDERLFSLFYSMVLLSYIVFTLILMRYV